MTGQKRQSISPELVGKSFVKQYYEHLAQDTHNLYRFYKDESTFTHGEVGEKHAPAVSGMANIKQKIGSLGLSDVQGASRMRARARTSVRRARCTREHMC